MAFGTSPEEYKERLLKTLRNDSEIVGRRISFWERDLDINQYTLAQRELKSKEIEDEQTLQNVIDSLAEAVEGVETE